MKKIYVIVSCLMVPSFIISDELTLSENIARAFLLKHNQWILRADKEIPSIEEYFFGKNAQNNLVEASDVKIYLKKEEGVLAPVLILETEVRGTPEDFRGEQILENELSMLKFVIIKNYLNKSSQIGGKEEKITVALDHCTKALASPSFLVISLKNGSFPFCNETQTYSKDRMGMLLITVFSVEEFYQLVEKYVVAPKIIAAAKKEKAAQAEQTKKYGICEALLYLLGCSK